jgi:hypothetical protein
MCAASSCSWVAGTGDCPSLTGVSSEASLPYKGASNVCFFSLIVNLSVPIRRLCPLLCCLPCALPTGPERYDSTWEADPTTDPRKATVEAYLWQGYSDPLIIEHQPRLSISDQSSVPSHPAASSSLSGCLPWSRDLLYSCPHWFLIMAASVL